MNEAPTISSGASKSRRRFLWAWIILIILAVFCSPFIFAGLFFLLNPLPTAKAADAGFKKAKETIDPEQLRAWAMGEIPKYPPQANSIFPPKILNSEIPNYLQKLYSEHVEDAYVYREPDSTNIVMTNGPMQIIKNAGQTNITIFWGGPFFHWMLEIGATNYVPEKDPQVMIIEWVPGIYYAREDTVHPFQ
ncbi:MAG TPA: hypothetical protein VNU95_10495 [Candidatus Acidoferrales bacterium]|nr:hypothetical protein [Candidatus Acidoferrales bacterium]